MRRIAAVVWVCVTQSGCIWFVPSVNDLKLTKIQPVEVQTLKLSNSWYPASNGIPKWVSNEKIGSIEVVTRSDLHGIGERWGLNIWHELSFCDSDARIVTFRGVYYNSVDINLNGATPEMQRLNREHKAHQPSDQPFRYKVYFELQSSMNYPKAPGNPKGDEPYDLQLMPRDICLRIGGGNMAGGYFVSNKVIVPSKQIEQELSSVTTRP